MNNAEITRAAANQQCRSIVHHSLGESLRSAVSAHTSLSHAIRDAAAAAPQEGWEASDIEHLTDLLGQAAMLRDSLMTLCDIEDDDELLDLESDGYPAA